MILLTVAELAQALKHHPETIRLWCRQKKIPFVRMGREYRFEPELLSGRVCAADKEEVCQSADEKTAACSWISTTQADAELERLLKQETGGKRKNTTTGSKPSYGKRHD